MSATGCSSTAAKDTQRSVTVTYAVPAADLQQTLVSQNIVSAEEAYAKRQAGPNLKVLPDQDAQVLMQQLRQSDFFQLAQPASDPSDTETLTVTLDGKTLILGKPAAERRMQRLSELKAFVTCKLAFMTTFNAAESYSSFGRIQSDEVNQHQRQFRAKGSTAKRLPQRGRKGVHTIDMGRGKLEQVVPGTPDEPKRSKRLP